MTRIIRKPWTVDIKCDYEEHTADIEDNQILVWTLFKIARSGMCTDRVLPTIRRAYRMLQGRTKLTPHLPSSCLNRLYNRLNNDYEPMHALCRFFLEQSGPTHEIGDRSVLPFIVNMSSLFELFVAEWLKKNLPPHLSLKSQEKVHIGEGKTIRFDIDLVIYDKESREIRYVLDTKYKTPDSPSSDDIAQVVAYSEAKDCNEAILIYPSVLKSPIDEWVGNKRVRSLTFDISGELEKSGELFLKYLIQQKNID